MFSKSNLIFCLLFICSAGAVAIQPQAVPEQLPVAQQAGTPHFPSCIRYTGTLSGQAQQTVNLTFAVYKDQQGDQPLWQESQNVELDASGRFSALLGFASPGGVPQSIFLSSDAQWLGVRVNNGPELPRALLVSVPYAMKAQTADTLAGLPASDFVLRSELPQLLQTLGLQQSPIAAVPLAQAPGNFVPQATTVSNPTTVMQSNSATDVLMVEQDGTGYSLHVVGNSNSAILAETTSQSDSTFTILSVNHAPGGTGMRAEAQATTGHGFGVMGVSFGDTGTGVYGENSRLTGTTYGVRGKSLSDSGMGVFGTALSSTGPTTGVRGQTSSPSGTAGVFDAYNGGNIISGRSSGVEKFRIDAAGNMTATGAVTAASFAGDGSTLTNVNASFLGGSPASSFLRSGTGFALDNLGNLTATSFAGDGSKLTNVNANFLNGFPASTFFNADTAMFQKLNSTQLQINPDPQAATPNDGQYGSTVFMRDDLDTVHSMIGQAGSQMHFRLHRTEPDLAGVTDFLIAPYKFGMSIEYGGVVEVWSKHFSVHVNNSKQPGPEGAQFWVGDQLDTGGLYVTGNVSSLTDTGNVIVAADKFDHSSHGTLNFVTRNQADPFRFLNGPWGLEKTQAQLFTTQATSNFEVDSGSLAGALIADSSNNLVQIGSRTGNRVDIITADASPQVSVFVSGDVSIGSTVDSAKLSVGDSAQFQVSSAGAVTIGGGTLIAQHISTTTTVSFNGLEPATCTVVTTIVTGAADADSVALGVPNAIASAGDLVFFGWVSSPDTVSIRACNMGAANPGALSGITRVDVWKH